MIKPLLIEIATEELPAIPFLKELPNIQQKWSNILEENSLLCDFNFYYTPRRLVFWHREFPTKQEDKIIEHFGAPINIAYKDGKPTKAAIGFAKKCNTQVQNLTTIDKGKGEILYYKSNLIGKNSKDLLNDMINKFIRSLNFGKSMRWGNIKESFIRPIRSVSVVLGDELVDVELFEVASSKSTFPHPMVSYEKVSFDFAGEYFCKLDKNAVILYQDERRKIILDQMKKLEQQHQITIEKDPELLDEIVAITEYPTALLGTFDENFLQLPPEVIISSMKEHQRYFAVYKDNKLTNNFIVVSNAYTDDFSYIIKGNEKVLRPRLSDAMFFWQNDIKNGLSNEGLKDVSFVDGLGSIYDKCERESKIALNLATKLNQDSSLVQEAVMISKADLLTDVVYEFTDLQGLMGYYYAKKENRDEKVSLALKEQYLPTGEHSELPSSIFSSIVALSNKIDNLLALFSVGMIPSGSRDPFALRRAALGIFRICYEHKIELDLEKLIDEVSSNYTNLDKSQVLEFVNERLYKFYPKVNPSVVKAVLNSTTKKDILNICLKIEALNSIVNSSDFKAYSDTFKRVANIVKDLNSDDLAIDESLFEQDEEKILYAKYNVTVSKEHNNYEDELDELFSLKPQLDSFFDNVFVNHEDQKIKQNRKNLIGIVYNSFRTIADIRKLLFSYANI